MREGVKESGGSGGKGGGRVRGPIEDGGREPEASMENQQFAVKVA